MYVSVDDVGFVRAISDSLIRLNGCKTIYSDELDSCDRKKLIGKKIRIGRPKNRQELRIAVVCNWGDQCGIATYSQAIFGAMKPNVADIRIFAEQGCNNENAVSSWTRGESMCETIRLIKEYDPDIVHVQHEFGIFPKATHFLKMLEMLDEIPYIFTLHSVYQHLDKTVCTGFIKNVIVHSQTAKAALEFMGHSAEVYVVEHGCEVYRDTSELWNIFHNDYTVVQFGFGFQYKGVDIAIDAIDHLKKTDPKFKDIFYCYICSENPHTKNVHNDYYMSLKAKISALNLNDNIAILRGFLPQAIINNYLRTAKISIFPYKSDPNNIVFGASGAIRHGMACGVPVIASESHMFDDLESVVPRIKNSMDLAIEIDRIFSSSDYKNLLVKKNLEYVRNNSWNISSEKTIDVYLDVIERFYQDSIIIESCIEV